MCRTGTKLPNVPMVDVLFSLVFASKVQLVSKGTGIDNRVFTRLICDNNETILDLSGASLLYVLTGRFGPGYKDVVMPGTFLDEGEEREFLARLIERPPAVVIFPGWRFDDMNERSVQMLIVRTLRWLSRLDENVATVPSSNAASSWVALSVSISASTSPAEISSPSLHIHLINVPSSMVSDIRGISTMMGISNIL